MKIRTIGSYGEIEGTLDELCINQATNKPWHEDNRCFLFRGQGNAEYPIQSTLERAGWDDDRPFYDYYWKTIHPVLPMIQSISSLRFELGKPNEIKKLFENAELLTVFGDGLHAYKLLAFMRHHGYPSPLIDWSLSPYVALYFACSKDLDKDGALWGYTEFGDGLKWATRGKPWIKRLGHYLTTHERHHRQQGDYLIGCQYKLTDETNGNWHIIPFHRLYEDQDNTEEVAEQDIFNKIIIKAEAKVPILKRLDAMNVNAYSLFNTMDSLMETERVRRFTFKNV